MKEKIDKIVDAIVLGALSQAEATEELLKLLDVSQIREMLLEFYEWSMSETWNNRYNTNEQDVDEFLTNIIG